MTAALAAMPPRHRLGRVVRALARHLPPQLPELLGHSRFAAGTAALARLHGAHLDSALAALGDDEAAWLADQLEARWRAIAEPVFEPEAALVAPTELWIGREPIRLALELIVDAAEPGWEAIWDGATATGETTRAVVVIAPSADVVLVRAHVRARAAGVRVALTAAARIEVRRPSVTVRDDRRRLVITDQGGRPAVAVAVRIGDDSYTTGPGGLIELKDPATPGATIHVAGIAAGRIGDGGGER